jgi:hypothetical protein
MNKHVLNILLAMIVVYLLYIIFGGCKKEGFLNMEKRYKKIKKATGESIEKMSKLLPRKYKRKVIGVKRKYW